MSGTQYNQEHRLHETNEPLQSARPTTTGVTDTGMPPTGQRYDPTLGRSAGAGVSDEYNTTQGRTSSAADQYNTTHQGHTASAGVPNQYNTTQGGTASAGVPNQYNTTQGHTSSAGVPDQYNTTQGRTAGAGVPNQYNATQGRTAGAGVPNQYNATQGHTAGAGVPNQYNTTQGRTAGTGVAGHPGQQYDTSGYFPTNASSNRPLNDMPMPQGGAAFGGQSNLPFGYPDLEDKIIGKTQKAVGRMTNNPKLLEKGELRESGGKAAVLGLARPPHH